MTSELRQELEMIHLDQLKLRPKVNSLIFNNKGRNFDDELNHFLESHPGAVFHVIDEEAKCWEDMYRRVTPFNSLKYIAEWVDRLSP